MKPQPFPLFPHNSVPDQSFQDFIYLANTKSYLVILGTLIARESVDSSLPVCREQKGMPAGVGTGAEQGKPQSTVCTPLPLYIFLGRNGKTHPDRSPAGL